MSPELAITQLVLAELELPTDHPEGRGHCTVFGFLVRDHDFTILVDTGVGAESELIDRRYHPTRYDLAGALQAAGVEPGKIDAIVNSHLHFDHCGSNRLFAGTPIFVQAAEFEASRSPYYTRRECVDFAGAKYELVRGEHALSPHVTLVPSPGHTPGHQSVLVGFASGPQLIVAQAAYTAREFEASRHGSAPVPQGTWNEPAYGESLRRLHRLAATRAYFSHDASVWQQERGLTSGCS
jgi:glyoxylase-like metal-dependent hydrolase (beta-lactamase superfamily II)